MGYFLRLCPLIDGYGAQVQIGRHVGWSQPWLGRGFLRALALAAALTGSASATAQDFGLSVIDGAIGTEGIRSATQEARREQPHRQRTTLSPRAARYCATRDSLRARFGANDARVRNLYRLCRQAGL